MRHLAYFWMRLTGWTILGEPPSVKRFLAIGYPHTSNLDYLLFLGVARLFNVPAKAIAKHTLVSGPLGFLFRRAVIPIERDSRQGMVEQMVRTFAETEALAVVMAPEGTRKRTESWRSGFYRIAHGAGVPVVPVYVDWTKKIACLGEPIELTGDVSVDMDAIRSFLAPGVGRHPDQATPVRLADEDGTA